MPVSNYSELTHSVGLPRSLSFSLLPLPVSNYSELTHSVGEAVTPEMTDQFAGFQLFRINPFGRAQQIDGECNLQQQGFQLFRINPFGRVVDMTTLMGQIYDIVSNYSELTHSVGLLHL